MLYRWDADLTVATHSAFILFVIFGGLMAWKWSWLKWAHPPALIYGLLTEIFNWYCPLTSLEIELRGKAGLTLYEGSFISAYLNRLIYLDVSQKTLIVAASAVCLLNLLLYAYGTSAKRPPSE